MNEQLRITKAIFARTGSYDDMHYRPFATNINDETTNLYMEMTRHETELTPLTLAGLAGNILRPVTETMGVVPIVNGWGTERLRFLLEITITTGLGDYAMECVGGYSDYLGVGNNLSIDPNLRLMINSTSKVRQIRDNSVIGTGMRSSMADASHIITTPYMPAAYQSGFKNNGMELMRPMDLVSALQTDANYPQQNAQDLRANTTVTTINKSNRTNTVSSDYLTKAVNSIVFAQRASDEPYNQDAHNVLNAARKMSREAYISDDAFIRYISAHTGYMGNNYVTYGELCRLFPELDIIKNIPTYGQAELASKATRGQYSDLNAPTQETIVATMLSNMIPGIMLNLMITDITFEFTSDTNDNHVDVDIKKALSFGNVDLKPYILRFIDRLIKEVVPDITYRGAVVISVAMRASILGDTRMSISYNGGPNYDFVIPTFCDGMFAPVITPDYGVVQNAASDISCLANSIGSEQPIIDYGHTQPRHQPQPLITTIQPTGANHGSANSRFLI